MALMAKLLTIFIHNMANNDWIIRINRFEAGYSPLAFTDNLTEFGSSGMASVMSNVDVLNGKITQGPALADLTAGTQAGAVTELITYIMDRAVADNVTYAIGTSKLFQLSATAVTNAGIWPHAITNCTDGESIVVMGGNLYYFYNKAAGGDIGKYDLATTYADAWGSSTPTGAAALQKAPHPSDKKEDLFVFGNGRYAGVYRGDINTLYPTKLDFGNDAEVSDVLYHAGQWYLAVNSGVTGTNRTEGQVYLYDGSAITSQLADETGVGMQRIGFLYRLNGVIYVAYQDLSSTGFIIGYIQGKQIKPLGRFTGTLPNFAQKTLYKGTILFLSGGLVYSGGALVDTMPFQVSQYADGGYATCGAIAAPFGVPMISSTDGATNFRLAKFSGYDTACSWKSIVFPTISEGLKGYIDSITVLTKTLGANSRCDLTIEADQASATSTVQQITGTGKRRFDFDNFGLVQPIDDFRIALSWANGNASADCAIREIIIRGHSTGV